MGGFQAVPQNVLICDQFSLALLSVGLLVLCKQEDGNREVIF